MFKKISKLVPKSLMSSSSVDNIFVDFANKVIDELNKAIEIYQIPSTNEERIDQLKKINMFRKQLEDMCPQDIDVSVFAEEIVEDLFIRLADECNDLGIKIVDLEEIPEALQNIPFLRLQANMHPAQLEELFEILYSAKRDKQGKLLWDPDKWIRFVKKYPEFNGYVLKCCSAGNSKNFMLTSLDPNTPQFMLRLDDRLGGARIVDAEVRKTELVRFLTPIAGTRLINSKRYDSKKKVMEKYNPTLLITTVCPNGTPLDHARKNLSLESKIEGATKIYGQMSYIFSRMQAHNIFCPDGKNENWLINDKNLLCVADNKSWMHSQDGYHDIDKTFLKNSLAYGSTPALITSYGFTPSYINDECFEIDKMHCFILGNNMYQYLTGCSNSALEKGLINFELPIFKTPDGELFAKLIKDCRDGTTTVLTVLDTFFAKDKECVALSDLERIPIINGDNLMKSWINAEKSKLIEGVLSPEKRTELAKKIADFTREASFLSDVLKQNELPFFGYQQQKIENIKKAYHETPIELRAKIMKVPSIQRVLGTWYTVFGFWAPDDSQLESNQTFKKYKNQYLLLLLQASIKELSEEDQTKGDSEQTNTMPRKMSY